MARAVGMDREEQVGIEPPRDRHPLGMDQIAIVVAGHGDAHIAFLLQLGA